MRFTLIFSSLILATSAWAQSPTEATDVTRVGPYLGVQPGAQDQAPGKYQLRSKGALQTVTWVGFQMAGQGGRVFVQTTEPALYEIVPGDPNEVVLELRNARIHSKNDTRLLETGWFPTAVTSVKANQKKGSVVRVTIKLREIVGYDLRQEGNYVFLDFRPPQKLTAPPPQTAPTP